ncbi:MAG: hypothetical protein FJ146_05835 [Deltaproteobacteria bacterium]|nr:hypothetical protein [Deltaproteobacteria bacterium]
MSLATGSGIWNLICERMSIEPKMSSCRYAIGIDLGTTNCSLAYVDLDDASAQPRVFAIPQWEQVGTSVADASLPSFYYVPLKSEWKRGQLNLPHHPEEKVTEFAIGRLARWQSSRTPGRVIHQAKSWLCHDGVDREERILPWQVGELIGDERRSPVEVAAAFLTHLREAWDYTLAAADARQAFCKQNIVITVPASFDEVAQRLTLRAADLAGYPMDRVRLLEEPQAAFYDWLATDEGTALEGQVLICDVGGGTTDFSLFTVDRDRQITRVAVGDHLLLGGDNIDLAIARSLEQKIVPDGDRLSSRAWTELVFAARLLKEEALKEDIAHVTDGADGDAPSRSDLLSVSIAGDGASLMASARTATISRDEVLAIVRSGFFPRVAATAKPQTQRLGFTSLGLRYAVDTAVTKHLAAFLEGRRVDAVLFNGGTLAPLALQREIITQIAAWQGGVPPRQLNNKEMHLSVALGAARYSVMQVQRSALIKGGYARSVYVEVDTGTQGTHGPEPRMSARRVMCIVPQGYDGTHDLTLTAMGLKVRADQPVRFQLYTSTRTRRAEDRVGEVLTLDHEEFRPLPPLTTKINISAQRHDLLIDVSLDVRVAETGLLALKLVSSDPMRPGSWQLDFNLRAPMVAIDDPVDLAEDTTAVGLDETKLKHANQLIDVLFGKKKILDRSSTPRTLIRDLESTLDLPREQWSTEQLRALWPQLADGMTRRSRSPEHESQWLSLAGYALRPGFGHVHDEWRMQDLWRSYEQGLFFPKDKQVEDQWWIMWRRVAGGLNKVQQSKLWDRIYPAVRRGDAAPELYLLAGSLERIDMQEKIRLGSQLVQQLAAGRRQHVNQKMWALARLASRVPLYGGSHQIVRPEPVVAWFEELQALRSHDPAYAKLPLFLSQAGRMIGDREYDLPAIVRQAFLSKLKECRAAPEQVAVVAAFVPVDHGARSQLFGEALPVGLVLS